MYHRGALSGERRHKRRSIDKNEKRHGARETQFSSITDVSLLEALLKEHRRLSKRSNWKVVLIYFGRRIKLFNNNRKNDRFESGNH